jgi:cytochrome c-type biogenesis protein CcmH/NrfG
LFGVPIGADALVLTGAAGTGVFDRSSLQIVRGMRSYDFAAGPKALLGKWERRAVDVLAGALPSSAGDPKAEAHRIVSRGYAAARDYDDAARHLRESVRLDPKNTRLRMELAVRLRQAGEVDEAIADLKTAVAMEPQNPEPHAILGSLYLNRRSPDHAVEELRTATQLEPRYADYQVLLGEALSRQPGGIREAAAAFDAAMRLRPNSSAALTGLLRETGVEERMRDALVPLLQAAKDNPNSVEARLNLGSAYLYGGDLAAARGEFVRAIELDGKNGAAHLAMARVHYLEADYRSAEVEVRAARAAGVEPSLDLVNAINRNLGAAPVAPIRDASQLP